MLGNPRLLFGICLRDERLFRGLCFLFQELLQRPPVSGEVLRRLWRPPRDDPAAASRPLARCSPFALPESLLPAFLPRQLQAEARLSLGVARGQVQESSRVLYVIGLRGKRGLLRGRRCKPRSGYFPPLGPGKSLARLLPHCSGSRYLPPSVPISHLWLCPGQTLLPMLPTLSPGLHALPPGQ